MTSKVTTTSPLIDAIRAGRIDGVIAALSDGANIEEPDVHGKPGLPLRAACYEGNLVIVRELLQQGAEPNTSTGDGPGAPLRVALRRGHKEVVDLLLQHGAHMPDGFSNDPGIVENSVPDESATRGSRAHPGEHDGNLIEFSPSSITMVQSADDNGEFGTETKALSADLLFLDELEPLDIPSTAPQRHP